MDNLYKLYELKNKNENALSEINQLLKMDTKLVNFLISKSTDVTDDDILNWINDGIESINTEIFELKKSLEINMNSKNTIDKLIEMVECGDHAVTSTLDLFLSLLSDPEENNNNFLN